MSPLLAEFESASDKLEAIASRAGHDRRSAEDEFFKLIEAMTAELEEKWRYLFLSPGTRMIPDDPHAEIVGGLDRIADDIIRASELQVRYCETYRSEFRSPRLDRCEQASRHVGEQTRRHWPFRDEAQIAASRAYFENGGKGINIKELLRELGG